MAGILDPGNAALAVVESELKQENAENQKKKDRLNRTIRRDPNGVIINCYCPCKMEGCRRPALLVTDSEYCPEHFDLGKKIVESGGTLNCAPFNKPLHHNPNDQHFYAMDRARQEKKAQAKRNKRALLAQLAYNSGNPKEFMRLRALERLQRSGRVEKVFARIDEDGNGYVDFDELKAALQKMGCGLKDDEVRQILTDADADGDGLITCDEFKNYLERAFPDDETSRKKKRKGGSRRLSALYDVRITTAHLPVHGKLQHIQPARRKGKRRKNSKPGMYNSDQPLPAVTAPRGSPVKSFFRQLREKMGTTVKAIEPMSC
jgi:hypothetical protein